MGQTVSAEAALPVFRERCSILNDENLMLRARLGELEQQLAALQSAAGEQPGAPTGGPDLASRPSYPADEQG
jgi:hypothetical protein